MKRIDCSKAIRDLGHNPKVRPEEGIKRTVEWMRRYYVGLQKIFLNKE